MKNAYPQLYGIAIGVAHGSNNYDRPRQPINLSCTTISVQDPSSRSFTIHEDLSFKTSFFLTHELQETFMRLVRLLGEVITLQESSCRDAKVDYQPVVVFPGQNSQDPVPYECFKKCIFGESSPSSHTGLLDELYKTMRKPDELANHLSQFAVQLKQCVWKTGNFTGPSPGNKKNVSDDPQTNEDLELLRLEKERDDSGEFLPDALNELKRRARNKGAHYGKSVNENNNIFKVSSKKNYHCSPELQQRHPSDGGYLQWHPEIIQAFNEGFTSVYDGRRFRLLKLATDAPQPFFSDPCADAIREIHQTLDGLRKKEDVIDQPEIRKNLIELSQNASNRLRELSLQNPQTSSCCSELESEFLEETVHFTDRPLANRGTRATFLLALVDFVDSDLQKLDQNFVATTQQVAMIRELAMYFKVENGEKNDFLANLNALKHIAEEYKSSDEYAGFEKSRQRRNRAKIEASQLNKSLTSPI